jgi:hypothetical protein
VVNDDVNLQGDLDLPDASGLDDPGTPEGVGEDGEDDMRIEEFLSRDPTNPVSPVDPMAYLVALDGQSYRKASLVSTYLTGGNRAKKVIKHILRARGLTLQELRKQRLPLFYFQSLRDADMLPAGRCAFHPPSGAHKPGSAVYSRLRGRVLPQVDKLDGAMNNKFRSARCKKNSGNSNESNLGLSLIRPIKKYLMHPRRVYCQ